MTGRIGGTIEFSTQLKSWERDTVKNERTYKNLSKNAVSPTSLVLFKNGGVWLVRKGEEGGVLIVMEKPEKFPA